MQDRFQSHLFDVAGVLVSADDPLETCPVCGRSMCVQKTVRHNGRTLSHGSFSVRETVRDVGTDLLREGHDKLRALFRCVDIRKGLRAFVRQLGHRLGIRIHETRADIRTWLHQPVQDLDLPEGAPGIAVARALAQWILDFSADGNNKRFPFDLPHLNLYVRCLHIRWAVDGFLQKQPEDAKVKKFLARLQKILAPIDCDVPPFARAAQDLIKQANIFAELRSAFRLAPKSGGRSDGATAPLDAPQPANEFEAIRAAVDELTARLKQRRPERGPARDIRQAFDIVLTHLDRHGPFLWGHAITLNTETGCVRLVDRTNNILEGCFHGMKHGERRRSGRKILTQDFERLPSAAALAMNLNRPD